MRAHSLDHETLHHLECSSLSNPGSTHTHTHTDTHTQRHIHTKKMLIKSRCRGLFLYNWCDTTPWKKTRLNKRHRQGDRSQKLSAFCSGPNVLHLCQIRARSGPDPYSNPLHSG